MKKYYIFYITVLSLIILIYPYLFNTTFFPIGWDGGQYFDVLLGYLKSDSLLFATDYWYEPGFFFSVNIFIRILGVDPIFGLKLFITTLFLLQFFLIHLLLRLLIPRLNSLSTILIQFLPFSINFFYIFLFKQYTGQIFLLSFLFIFLTLIKNKSFRIGKIIIAAIFLAYIFYSHRGITLATGILLFFLTVLDIKKGLYFKYIIIITFLSILLYGPFLYFVLQLEFRTFSDFVEISQRNVVNSKKSARGISLIDAATGARNQILMFIIFNPVLWFPIFANLKNSFLLGKQIFAVKYIAFPFLIYTIFCIYLVHYGVNFSARFTTILFIFLSLWLSSSLGYFFKKNKFLSITIFLTLILLGTISISGKSFYLSKRDSVVDQFQSKIPIQNSLIVTIGGVSLLPSYLGYETTFNSSRIHIYAGSIDSDTALKNLRKDYASYLLANPDKPKLLQELGDKDIYIVLGLFLNNNYPTKQGIISPKKFLISPYYELVLDAKKYHPLRYVFRLKREMLLSSSEMENIFYNPFLY